MFIVPRTLIRNLLLVGVGLALVVCFRYGLFDSPQPSLENAGPDSKDAPTDGTAQGGDGRELMLTQMLFRHGHRSPFMLYPYDPNIQDDWPEGLGMLTQLGRLQHYAMGVYLRKRYENFITSNPKEIEMINSNNFRCQYGIYCFIAGLYEPQPEFRFTDELSWQPIISRSADWKGRYILTRNKCKVADEDSKALKRGSMGAAVKEHYRDLYNFWSKNSGRLIDTWTLAADLGKTLACEKEYNLTIPDWGLEYWDEFDMQAAISYYFNYGTKLIQRYRIGPLLRFMIEKSYEKILGKLNDKRVFIYSAHGSNIACLMLALDQYNWKSPPYASTVVFELWREKDDYSVRWLYFNSSNPEKKVDPPVVFKLDGACGGKEFCPLSNFTESVRRLIPENWAEECHDKSQKERFLPLESTVQIPSLSASVTITVSWWTNCILLFICFFLYCQQ